MLNPTTGIRPRMLAVSVDEDLNLIDQNAMQECSECEADSTTRWCPRYRQLGNQGTNHRFSTYVKNACSHATCQRPICDVHMHPNSRDSEDTPLKFLQRLYSGQGSLHGLWDAGGKYPLQFKQGV